MAGRKEKVEERTESPRENPLQENDMKLKFIPTHGITLVANGQIGRSPVGQQITGIPMSQMPIPTGLKGKEQIKKNKGKNEAGKLATAVQGTSGQHTGTTYQ